MTLVLRTDAPRVYVGLWIESKEVSSHSWEAGRELSKQLLTEITSQCESQGVSIDFLDKVVVYKGPGSYTGLRIGMSVANAIGYSNNAPVIAVSGEHWIQSGLQSSESTYIPATPEYGGNSRVTAPKK